MKTPLVPEEEDPRWELVGNVLKIFEQRKVRKIVSKFGIKPLDRTIGILKIVILAMCFGVDITFVISELKAKASLREFTSVYEVPEANNVYRLLSRFTVEQFVDMVLRIVNTVCEKRKGGRIEIIGDTTNLTVDLKYVLNKRWNQKIENYREGSNLKLEGYKRFCIFFHHLILSIYVKI
jgi:hypothetical protein